jgi:hypothetical protein
MNLFEELKCRNVCRVGFACTTTISMTAIGRKRTLNSAVFGVLERPLSGKVDIAGPGYLTSVLRAFYRIPCG